ncbi:MAG: carbon-nitrogen hydrolase family protein, partial [Spirochaetales bacterium]|nr:carbon-nitrogen hydrolase family protein [Spirochaetales bacterium]MCF7939967.1 carbon-nitrogen hydrolase family protein [Spirochaetales bacterium]
MNKPRPFLLAMVQMHVEGGKKEQNIAHAGDLIAEAAAAGAELALLPECLDLGWCHPTSAREAEPIPAGASFKALARAAETNRIALCAGLTEEAEGEVYNTAVYITSKGEPAGIHRKINELDIGLPFYSLGDRLNVIETEFGKAGIIICADAFAEDRVLTRSLGYMGADFILSPSAWAVPADHDN